MSSPPAPSESNASHLPSGETSIASMVCEPLVIGVAPVVPIAAPDGIGTAHTLELCVNTEYTMAWPSRWTDAVCALSPVVRRLGEPIGCPLRLSLARNRSRLPSRSETNRRRSAPSHAGLVFRLSPSATSTASPPLLGMTHTLLGARFPMLMNPTSIWDAAAPYTNPSLPDTAATHRPSGDHASECASVSVPRSRTDPPPTDRAST